MSHSFVYVKCIDCTRCVSISKGYSTHVLISRGLVQRWISHKIYLQQVLWKCFVWLWQCTLFGSRRGMTYISVVTNNGIMQTVCSDLCFDINANQSVNTILLWVMDKACIATAFVNWLSLVWADWSPRKFRAQCKHSYLFISTHLTGPSMNALVVIMQCCNAPLPLWVSRQLRLPSR